ncbi:TPA: NTP transferase domain-containing protein [Vibrio cholerae]|nr:NTP transferase domain-containing protein [Vibrio cholerae]HDQ5434019.1 NTP transferase domain-containing protein [Vibrio cholerae]
MIKKCLFPAAGYGTRFLPATKSMPKEMMPVVNKPLIEYGVDEAIQAGITGMCIVTGRGKHSIMDHFDMNYELEHQIRGTNKEELLGDIRKIIESANFTFIRQREMKGLGHAILTGKELVGDEPFAVVLADDLCVNEEQGVLAQMVALYKQFRCSIVAVQEVPENETHKYGVIAGEMIKDDLFRVDNMVEKPEPGKGGEIQITDALLKQAKAGCVLAYKFKGKRFDCGSVEGYIEATNFCYENMYKKNDQKVELAKKSTHKGQ